MTDQEALNYFKRRLKFAQCGKSTTQRKAFESAIEALENQNKLAEAIHRIEALNPMDYGCMGNYKVHKGARMMKKDVLDILNDLIEEEEQEDKCEE